MLSDNSDITARLDTLIAALSGSHPDLASIAALLTAANGYTDGLEAKLDTLIAQTAPYTNPDRLSLPTIGTAAVPVALAALPAALDGGVCRGIVSDQEGSRIVGLMSGSTELCSDYAMAGDGSLWTAGADIAWSQANHRFDFTAATASLRFTGSILKDARRYGIVIRLVAAGGSVQVECGSGAGGLSVALATTGIYLVILDCTTSLQVGVKATAFTGSVNLLRPLRLHHYMAAGVEYPDKFTLVAACASGTGDAGAKVDALY